MTFIPFLLFGLLIGFVVRMLVRQAGLVASMLIGAAGALAGATLARAGGLSGTGEPPGFVLSLLGAFAFVALYHTIEARRRRA